MKIKLILLSLVMVLFSTVLISCKSAPPRRVTDNSNKFTSLELSKAMDIAERDFNKTKDRGTTLKKIVYNEDKSNKILDEFSVTLKEDYTPLNLENFIVILLDFETGKDTEALEPNQTYTDFHNIMIKDKNKWKIISGGY